MALTDAIVRFAAQLRYEDIPSPVVEHCKTVILDALGCAIAASTLGDACPQSIEALTQADTSRDCSVFGTSQRASAANAAFLNGALIHALNFDATGNEIGHQGVVCLAAPFAFAEMGASSGKDLITASVVACEVSARITAAIARTGRHPSEKFLAGQLLSYIGAAAGAGRMLQFDEATMHSALGLSLMQMSGSRQVVLQGDPPAKSIYGAFPNQGAVQSCLLARAGVDARCDLFGPPAGLYSMIYGGQFLPEVIGDGLGRDYLMLEADIKPWPCSMKIGGFVAAAIAMFGRIRAAENIAGIEISAPEKLRPWFEPDATRRRPANASAAANSVQYCMARALSRGALLLDDFTEAAFADESTHRLADMVRVEFCGAGNQVRIEVTVKNGSSFEENFEEGAPAKRFIDDRVMVLAKFRSCCQFARQGMGSAAIERLIEKTSGLERIANVADLFERQV